MDRQRLIGRGDVTRPQGTQERYEELCGQCWKGRLCVTTDGTAFPCIFSRATRLGDARRGLSEILRGVQLRQFRAKVRAIQAGRIEASSGKRAVSAAEEEIPCVPNIADPCTPVIAECVPNIADPCTPVIADPCTPVIAKSPPGQASS